ncbi:uncharacterized protein PF3D7_1223600-like isoform X1 [Daktulosphaira vitifoliae]|uniref:uncharacterized protein PF3D7_1223600-like isoform X1 n=1 Tax=Daktulosphaira vitifoliae TaxID=58002 RepID=UPI0021AA3981|nr:uncharacterized protein PF3D7_1223600-like isoform X1 [Daktulosphaira vitifoliae]
MKNFLLFIFILYLITSLSYQQINLQCSYVCYFLNFFNHNERFLLEFEKKKDYITIENIMTYGKALQTHGKVIMIFLDDLINKHRTMCPLILITINMYFNNVSETLNMIAQNDDGGKNDAEKLLKGYKIIHFTVKEQLEMKLNKYCCNIPIDDYMVSCKPPISENEYTITNLINKNNDLKDSVLTKFNLSEDRNSYEIFHPKNILFYDLMTPQIIYNKNNTIKIDNSQHIELNLLRFTPLKFSNRTSLTIQDVFEYMKYNFYSLDVIKYIKMVIIASFRPIAILIRNFITLIHVASSKNSNSVTSWIKNHLIGMGHIIIKYIKKFDTLGLFNHNKSFLRYKILKRFIKALNNYTNYKKLSEIDIEYNNKLIKVLSNFFIKNKLYFTTNIVLSNENINKNNVDEIKNQLEKIIQKVGIYMNDLQKWSNHINLIKDKCSSIWFYNNIKINHFITSKVLDSICRSETHSEIYNASTNDINKIDIGFYEDVEDDYNYYWKIITEINSKELKDDHNKSENDINDSLKDQSNNNLLCMFHYLPYNE